MDDRAFGPQQFSALMADRAFSFHLPGKGRMAIRVVDGWTRSYCECGARTRMRKWRRSRARQAPGRRQARPRLKREATAEWSASRTAPTRNQHIHSRPSRSRWNRRSRSLRHGSPCPTARPDPSRLRRPCFKPSPELSPELSPEAAPHAVSSGSKVAFPPSRSAIHYFRDTSHKFTNAG